MSQATPSPATLPRWRTDDLYPAPDSPEYRAALDGVQAGVAELGALFDRLGIRKDGQQDAAAAVAAYDEATSALNALLTQIQPVRAYASALVSTDSRNDAAQAALSQLSTLTQPLSVLSVRYSAWLGGLDAEQLRAASALAREHAWSVTQAQEAARHQMSPAEEELAALLDSSGGSAWGRLHETLSSQMAVPLDGESLPMPAVRNLAGDPDERVREAAYAAELAAWKESETAMAAALNGVKGRTNVLNRRRGYADAVEPTLSANSIDRATLEAMQGAVVASFPDFRRYFAAKARVLGRADGRLRWSDLFAPVGEAGREWSYAEAQEAVERTFRRFSGRLGDFAARAFADHWLDVPPAPGKRGGAFCMGWRPGESRVLLNYAPNLDSVSTLAHELGHGYHNLCLGTRTPLQRATPMTLAETASIFCETIMQQNALQGVTGQERLYVLETMLMGQAQVVVDIHSRFLFESAVFQAREARELSPAELCALMERAQWDTYGEALSSLHPYMWAVKSHYYGRAFYNYPYTFGLLFGTGLYARYQDDPDGFRAQYDELLSRTGMDSAAGLAAGFGIDVRDRAFWERSLDVIRASVDEYERLVGGLA